MDHGPYQYHDIWHEHNHMTMTDMRPAALPSTQKPYDIIIHITLHPPAPIDDTLFTQHSSDNTMMIWDVTSDDYDLASAAIPCNN